MSYVNYLICEEIFRLLERIELIDQVPFENFNPDDKSDVSQIAGKYIKPAVTQISKAKKDAICASLAYYSATDSAPFQLLRDRCQELSLPDTENWHRFFHWICEALFSSSDQQEVTLNDYTELLDANEARLIFANNC